MKITHVTTRVLDTLDDSPLVEGLPEPGEHVGPRPAADAGARHRPGTGWPGGHVWHGALAPALKVAVDVLSELTLGMDPRQL